MCIRDRCIAAQPYTKEFKKITAICEDGDGTMWLGTEKGIHQMCIRDSSYMLPWQHMPTFLIIIT